MDEYKLAEKLREFADVEGTEAGEYWGCLSHLLHYTYLMSTEFKDALIKAAQEELDHIDRTFEWVEEEVTYTRKVREFVPKDI